MMAWLRSLLELLPCRRHRLCERGIRTCWECGAYDRALTRARDGVSREDYRSEGDQARREVFREDLWARRSWEPGRARDQATVRAEDGPWAEALR